MTDLFQFVYSILLIGAHDTSLLESSFNSHPRDTYALLLLVSVFLNCCAITGVKVNCSGLTGLSGSVELSSGTVSSCRWVFWGLSRSPSSEFPTGWFLSTMDCGCRQRHREREGELRFVKYLLGTESVPVL